MGDEIDNAGDDNDGDEIHGDVENVEGDDTTEVIEGDTTVSVVTPAESSDVATETVIEHEGEIAVLQREVSELQLTVQEQGYAIEALQHQLTEAETAVVTTIEEVEEQIDAETEADDDESDDDGDEISDDDREPRSAGTHPLFRSWGDWRGRN